MPDRPEPFGVLVGSLPYMVGYTLEDRHVVMVAFDDDGRNGPIGCVDWAEGEDAGRSLMAMAEDTAAVLGRVIRGTQHRQLVLIGYGESGPSRTAALEDALLGTLDIPDPIRVQVDSDSYRVYREGEWTAPSPIPDVSAAAVFAGTPPPAASRDGLQERFEPLERPLFGALELAKVAALESSPPSLRAEIAQRTLGLIAAAGDDDPQHAATVAYLATDSTALDQIVFSAAQDASLLEALIRTYRAAPEEARPELAAAGAAASWLAGHNTANVEALNRHAIVGETSAALKMSALVQLGLRESLNPHELLEAWSTTLPDAIAAADQRWQQARDLGMPPGLAARMIEQSRRIGDAPAGHVPPPPEPHPPAPTIDGPSIS